MSVPLVNRVIDSGSPPARRATSRKRVGSPSAAKIRAGSSRSGASVDILLDVPRLLLPATLVHTEGLRAAGEGDRVKAGLRNREPGTVGNLVQSELDECHRLVRVVRLRVDGVGMPAEREEPLRLDLV